MITVQYAPTFIRMYKGLAIGLREEVKEKIALFRDSRNHVKLKVHKLGGRMEGRCAFSVNYKIRIVFKNENTTTVSLLYVGSHDEVY